MSVVEPEPDETPQPKPRTRTRRATSAPRRSKAKRTTKPPNRVEPGWLHEDLAEATLRLLKGQVTDELGNPALDVGKLPDAEPQEAGEEPAPVETLARVYAHIGHRVPGLRNVEKRLEGQDKTAGLGSDLLALIVQLARRNRPVINAALAMHAQQFAAKRAEAKAKAADKKSAVQSERQTEPGGTQ